MQEWKYWIALKMVDGLGDILIRNLISEFRSPQAVFDARIGDLMVVEGIGEKTVRSIKGFTNWDEAKKQAQNVKRRGFKLISMTDSNYPSNLLRIYNPPTFLYVNGDFLPEDDIAIAIVGTRLPNKYGRTVAEGIAEELTSLGITVVSGMARGIDSIAHTGTLKKGGRTIAVLGSGLDVIYPPENKTLYGRITKSGAVVTEFMLGTAPEAVNFPKRNRIISGLSLGVVVVQASEKSGSLISASFALEQNREVFAVPGNIGSKLSKGTNVLIKEGAKLIECVGDILHEIESFKSLESKRESFDVGTLMSDLSSNEKLVYSVLNERDEPIHIDEIIKITGINSSTVLSVLLSLELHGILAQLPGKMFFLKY